MDSIRLETVLFCTDIWATSVLTLRHRLKTGWGKLLDSIMSGIFRDKLL